MSTRRISLGKRGEDAAILHLRHRGYTILARNYRQKWGEVDIICRDGSCYVFVEVKTRTSAAFGAPVEAVTPRKQKQIIRAAAGYLAAGDLSDVPVRFDVIGIILSGGKTELTHIVDAFDGE